MKVLKVHAQGPSARRDKQCCYAGSVSTVSTRRVRVVTRRVSSCRVGATTTTVTTTTVREVCSFRRGRAARLPAAHGVSPMLAPSLRARSRRILATKWAFNTGGGGIRRAAGRRRARRGAVLCNAEKSNDSPSISSWSFNLEESHEVFGAPLTSKEMKKFVNADFNELPVGSKPDWVRDSKGVWRVNIGVADAFDVQSEADTAAVAETGSTAMAAHAKVSNAVSSQLVTATSSDSKPLTAPSLSDAVNPATGGATGAAALVLGLAVAAGQGKVQMPEYARRQRTAIAENFSSACASARVGLERAQRRMQGWRSVVLRGGSHKLEAAHGSNARFVDSPSLGVMRSAAARRVWSVLNSPTSQLRRPSALIPSSASQSGPAQSFAFAGSSLSTSSAGLSSVDRIVQAIAADVNEEPKQQKHTDIERVSSVVQAAPYDTSDVQYMQEGKEEDGFTVVSSAEVRDLENVSVVDDDDIIERPSSVDDGEDQRSDSGGARNFAPEPFEESEGHKAEQMETIALERSHDDVVKLDDGPRGAEETTRSRESADGAEGTSDADTVSTDASADHDGVKETNGSLSEEDVEVRPTKGASKRWAQLTSWAEDTVPTDASVDHDGVEETNTSPSEDDVDIRPKKDASSRWAQLSSWAGEEELVATQPLHSSTAENVADTSELEEAVTPSDASTDPDQAVEDQPASGNDEDSSTHVFSEGKMMQDKLEADGSNSDDSAKEETLAGESAPSPSTSEEDCEATPLEDAAESCTEAEELVATQPLDVAAEVDAELEAANVADVAKLEESVASAEVLAEAAESEVSVDADEKKAVRAESAEEEDEAAEADSSVYVLADGSEVEAEGTKGVYDGGMGQSTSSMSISGGAGTNAVGLDFSPLQDMGQCELEVLRAKLESMNSASGARERQLKDQIQSLSAELETWKRENGWGSSDASFQLKRARDSAEAQLATALSDASSAKQENISLREKLLSQQHHMEEQAETESRLKAQLVGLESTLESMKESVKEAEHHGKGGDEQSRQTIAMLEGKIDANKKSIQALEDVVKDRTETVKELRGLLEQRDHFLELQRQEQAPGAAIDAEQSRAEIEALVRAKIEEDVERTRLDLEKQIADLQVANTASQEALDARSIQVEELQHSLQESLKTSEEIQGELESALANLAESEKREQEFSSKVSELEQQLSHAQVLSRVAEEQENWKEEMSDIEEQQDDQANRLSEENKAMEVELQRARDQLADNDSTLESYRQQLSDFEKLVDELRGEVHEYEGRTAADKGLIASLEDKVGELSKGTDDQTAPIREAMADAEEAARFKIKQMEDRIFELQEAQVVEERKYTASLISLRNKDEKAAATIKELGMEKEEVEKRLAQSEQCRAEAEAKLGEALAEKEEASVLMESARKDLTSQVSQLEHQVSELQQHEAGQEDFMKEQESAHVQETQRLKQQLEEEELRRREAVEKAAMLEEKVAALTKENELHDDELQAVRKDIEGILKRNRMRVSNGTSEEEAEAALSSLLDSIGRNDVIVPGDVLIHDITRMKAYQIWEEKGRCKQSREQQEEDYLLAQQEVKQALDAGQSMTTFYSELMVYIHKRAGMTCSENYRNS